MSDDSNATRGLRNFYRLHGLQEAAHQTIISYLQIEPPRPASEAPQRLRGWANLIGKSVQSELEYTTAIDDMKTRGLVWEIGDENRTLIRDYLDAEPACGPVDGMPDAGTLQFSIHFARLLDQFWKGIQRERPGVHWAREWQSDELDLIYSKTIKGCLEFLDILCDEIEGDDGVAVDVAWLSWLQPCGPWRCQWWRKYENGYLLEVHYNNR